MAGTSLFALLDDIAALLDDISVMTKTAASKTAGVLGDDLALNANQLTGLRAERELPVVWAVAKGSFINKAILVPAALVISAIAPWAIGPLLVLGGLFLCFEGAEKVLHYGQSKDEQKQKRKERTAAAARSAADLKSFEKNKIRGAIRTDFILSAEIIVITLGTVAGSVLATRIGVLTIVAVAMTIGVYGLVAAIVKMDDAGLYLSQSEATVTQSFGRFLLGAAPRLMKLLSVVGTAAMFFVGGGILVHTIPPLHHLLHEIKHAIPHFTGDFMVEPLVGGVSGILSGLLLVALFKVAAQVRAK